MLITVLDYILISIYKLSFDGSLVLRTNLRSLLEDGDSYVSNQKLANHLTELFNRGLIKKGEGRTRFPEIYITQRGTEKAKAKTERILKSLPPSKVTPQKSTKEIEVKKDIVVKEENNLRLSPKIIEDIVAKLIPLVGKTVRDIAGDFLHQESSQELISELSSTLQDEITVFLIEELKD